MVVVFQANDHHWVKKWRLFLFEHQSRGTLCANCSQMASRKIHERFNTEQSKN